MLNQDELQKLLRIAETIDGRVSQVRDEEVLLQPQPEKNQVLNEEPEEEITPDQRLSLFGFSPENRLAISVPRTLTEEFTAGVSRGTDQLQAMGGGAVGLLAEAVGVKPLADWGLDTYRSNMEEAALNAASIQDPFEEIDGVGDLVRYTVGMLGEQSPQLLTSILGAGVGGQAGQMIVKKAITNEMKRRVAAGMTEKAAAAEVAKRVADVSARALRTTASKEALKAGAKTGAIAGAFATNYGQIAGGSFGQIEQETGQRAPLEAAAFAVPGAGLETAFEVLLASKISGAFRPAKGSKVTPGSVATGVGLGFAQGSALEAGTEYLQTGLEQAAVGAADPNQTIGDRVFNEKAERERRIAGVAGAVVGGPLGGVGGGVESLAPLTMRTLRDREIETTTTDETAPPAPTNLEASGWSQPVDVDGVTMRQHSAGVWAAFNTPEDFLPELPRVPFSEGDTAVLLPADYKNSAMLIARARAGLDPTAPADPPAPNEAEQDEDDDLEPADIPSIGATPGRSVKSAEDSAGVFEEAYRLRQSLTGASSLQDDLKSREEVASALRDQPPTPDPKVEPKSAKESAEAMISAAADTPAPTKSGAENAASASSLRDDLQAREGAAAQAVFGTPGASLGEVWGEVITLLQQAPPTKSAEESAGVIQKENAESERQSEIEMARQAQLENNSKKSPLDLAILRQRLARLEEVQRAKRERTQNENTRTDLDVRPQEQAVSFVAGLNTGDKVSVNLKRNVPNQKTKKLDEVEEAKDAVFVGRKENGNVILNVGTFNPDQTSLVGTSERMEFTPAEFSKIGMMSPPKYLKMTPVEEAIRSLVGDNPTIEDLEAKLGAPYTGKNGAQSITIKDGLSSDPIPVQVKWFNKRGEKGAIIPKATGKFTNSPLMTVRQMNQGLSVEVSDQRIRLGVNPDIQVEKRGGKNVVTAVNLWGKTYRRGKTAQDFSVNEMILSEGMEGERRRDSDQRRRDAGAGPIIDTDTFGRPIEPKKTFEARGLFSFDPIWRNSPERIAASKAQTAKEDAALFAIADSDFSEALRAADDKEARKKFEINNPAMLEVALRVRGLLDRVDKLDEVDRKFLENEFTRGAAFINKSRFDDDTKGLAIVALRQRIIEDFAERAGKNKAETRVGSSQYTDLFLNELNEIRNQRIKGSDKTALAKAEKLRQSPEKLSDEELEAGELSSERAKKIFARETNRSQKGVEADIDAAVERSMEKLRRKKAFNWLMTEKETEELLKLRDREAAEAADRKKKGRPPKKRQAYNRMPEDDARAELQSIADRYKELGRYKGKGVADKIFNPIAAAQGAALNAARAIRRREQSDFVDLAPDFFEDTTDFSDANPQRESEPIEKAFDAPQRKEVAQGAAEALAAPVTKGETPIDKKIRTGLVATTPQERLEVAFKINEDLTPEDREIALASLMTKTDESGRKIKGQKSGLTTEEKARSKVIKKYLNNEISYEQLYPNTGRRTGRPSDSGDSNVRRDPQGGAEPIQSRGRRSQGSDADGRPGRVDGGAAATTGDIPTPEAETSGGRPVRPPLDPQAARSLSRVAQRIFVQSFGKLSDEEMSQLSPAEIEAAYSAILSKTDSAAALEGRNAIAETAGSMADLAGKTGQELLEGFSVEYRQAQNDAAKAASIRANLGRLLKARAFAGTTPFLEALAKDRNNTESQRIRARELLKLIRRGVNLDNLAVQVGNYFNDKNEDVSWAGVLGQSSDGDVSVVINLAQRHDRDDAAETYLHELGHVAGMAKASRSIKLTPAEEAALNRLEDLREQAVLKAAERLGIQPTEGVPPDIQKLAQAVYAEAESKELSNNRTYGGLLDIREFVVETTNNPEFAALLADLGFGAQAPGQKTSLLGAVRQAWDATVNLMSGIKADVNSPLAMAFKDSWLINFANMGAELTALSDYTLPRVRRSKLRDEMDNMQRAANFVESEIETRNLAGTTEERAALLKEYKKANKRKAKSTTAEPQPQAAPSGFSTQGFNAGIATEPNFGEASRRLATRPTEAGAVESVFQTPRAPRAGEGVVNIGANPEPIIFPPLAAAPAESQEEPVAQKSVFQDVVTGATEGEGFRVGPVMEVSPFRNDVQEDPVKLPPREPKKEEKRAPEKIEADLKAWAVRLLAGGKDTTAFEKAIAFNESRIANKELSAEERSSAAKYLAILLDAFEAENLQRDVRQIPRLERKEVPADVIAPVKAEEPKKEAPKKEEPKKEEPPDEEPPKPPKPPKKPKIVPPAVTPATQKQSKSKKTERAAKAVESEKSPQVSDKTSPQKAAAPSEKQRKIYAKTNDEIPTSEELIALNQQVIAARPKGSTFGFGPGFDFTNLTPERARGLRDNLQEALRRIPNYQAPKDEPIMSRAARRVVRPVTKKTGGGKTYEVGGIFARDELLDARAGDLNINRKANVRADISRVEDLSRILRQQISKIYDGKTVPFGDLNTALGNLENPLTNDQLDRIDAVLEAQGETAADDLKKQFLRENRENFKKIKQPQALAKLPKEIATTIREMSGHVESLSRQLLNQKVVWDDLAITVDEALGIYLNRSYAIFDDPNWADRVKKNEGVIGAARRFIKNSLVTQEAQRLIAEGIAAGAPISQFDARAKAAKSILPSEVEEVLEGYLSIGESRPDTSVLSGRILGQKNLSILNKRGVIAPEIQALWGRYEDPSVNYAKTIAKLSALVNNDKFLNEIIDLGRAENWIWDPKNPQNKTAGPPRGYVKFESGENRSLQPLGGLYMIPELARGLRETDLSGNPEEMAAWYQAFTKLTAYSMAMKTVGSAAGQVRNALGQFFIMIASGNLSIGDIASGRFKNNLKFASRSVLAKNWGRYGKSMTRDKWRAEIEDMTRRGVLGESVSMGLLDELMQTSRAHGSPDFQDTIFEKFLSPAKWTWDFAKRSYAAGEEWAKVVIYLSEQQKYREAFPKWSDEQIKDRAARNARDVHWTYSNAPQIVQDIKKFPFIAPFVTFTSEVIRTTAQTIKLAREEISEGRRTGNEELERIGWQRIRGMMLVATVPTLVGSGAMALAGIDGDDEEALRKFLPDWQKNNQLIMFRRESGEVSFVDVSFLDYSQYFKKPIVALYRSFKNSDNASEILTNGAVQMALEALGPFTGEQIFSGAIADAMRNTDASGRQVYNPQDTPERIGVAVAKKIFWDPFIPGTAVSGSRILSAATGQVSESGRAYELANELGSVLLGQRISSLDAQQSLAFAANTFSRRMRDATMLFNREFNARGSRTAADITSGYLRANAARKRLSEWLRERQQAAVTLGLTRKETESILKANNLSNDVVKSIMTGIYPKYKASDEAVSEADPARVSAYRAILNDTEDTEILP
jgi:hypothetical protein